MELDEFLRLAGSKDFDKHIKALGDRLEAALAAEQSVGRKTDLMLRRSEEQDKRDAELDKRERSVRSKEAAVKKKLDFIAEQALKAGERDAALSERERAAAQQESRAEDRMSKARKMEESNAAERERLERWMSYLDKIPA